MTRRAPLALSTLSNLHGTKAQIPNEIAGAAYITNMLRIGWTPSFGGYVQLQLRALADEAQTRFATYSYRRAGAPASTSTM